MIYIETILGDDDTFRIERQKNSPKGEWYGISLSRKGTGMADNDEWIAKTFPHLSMKETNTAFHEDSNIEFNSDDIKLMKKVVKEADKLGWFDKILKTV